MTEPAASPMDERKRRRLQIMRADSEKIVGPIERATIFGIPLAQLDRDALLAVVAFVWAFPPPRPPLKNERNAERS